MYCPSCGSEERQLSQFCRACGTDLRVVRNSLERPDAITASAVSAREQIGMAVADKIRQMSTATDLETVAEDVLPSFEKFLESPEEKRLRRLRNGVITAEYLRAPATDVSGAPVVQPGPRDQSQLTSALRRSTLP